MENYHKLDCFLEGDIAYLRKPNIQTDIIEGEWHGWFNDMNITRFLTHGVFPVTREEEAKYVESNINSPKSLILSIIKKKNHKNIGVVSLTDIDLINRNAEIAIVMGFEAVPGAALEAMLLMTEHAFERLNLKKLNAGQHEGLWEWVNSLELIGYKIEGWRRKAGIRGGSYDIVLTGVTSDDYLKLKKERGEILTPDLYKRRRKENLFPKVKEFFEHLHNH